jgi:hypothetical protein
MQIKLLFLLFFGDLESTVLLKYVSPLEKKYPGAEFCLVVLLISNKPHHKQRSGM